MEREAASTRLTEVGAPAFAKLRLAYRQTDDIEVRLRIECESLHASEGDAVNLELERRLRSQVPRAMDGLWEEHYEVAAFALPNLFSFAS